MARGSYKPPKRPKLLAAKPEPPDDLRDYNIGRAVDCAHVEARAAMGMSLKHIAWSLDINDKYLPQRPDYERICAAWRRGRAKGIAVTASRLMRAIDEGNVFAQVFYLKTHAGWNDNPSFARPADMDESGRVVINSTDDDGARAIVVLPSDATSFEEWEARARSVVIAGPPPASAEPTPA